MIEILTRYADMDMKRLIKHLHDPEMYTEVTMGYDGTKSEKQVDSLYSKIKMDKKLYWGQILMFIFREPQRLIEMATALSKKSAEPTKIALGLLVNHMAVNLDNFTRDVGRARPWRKIKGTTAAIEVWRTEKDEIVGDPVNRNIRVENIDAALVGMAIMEKNTPADAQVMLSVSNAQYRDGARCDHLLDAAMLFSLTNEVQGMDLLRSAGPVLSNMLELTELLYKEGVEVGAERTKFYDLLDKYVKRELKPEDVPNALIEVGGWS